MKLFLVYISRHIDSRNEIIIEQLYIPSIYNSYVSFQSINQWKTVFESYDKDRSGKIELSELTQGKTPNYYN